MPQPPEKKLYQIGENEHGEPREKIQVMLVDTHMLIRDAFY